MNLQPVTGRPFTVTCVGCRRPFVANNTHGTQVYADIEGRPFVDYYCAMCAGDARAAAQTSLPSRDTNSACKPHWAGV